MRDWIIQKAVLWLINGFTKLSTDGWKSVLDWVKQAEASLSNGADKAEWVKEQLMRVFQITAPFALTLITELAVAWAKKQGWIK